jgi:hypothetical protein
MKGWVYIITTKSMPDLVKIGFSTKDPELRAAELNNTGNPHPYTVRYEILVNDPRRIEQTVHQLLKDKGFHENKEWFKCSLEIAVSAIREISDGEIFLENNRSNIQSHPKNYRIIDADNRVTSYDREADVNIAIKTSNTNKVQRKEELPKIKFSFQFTIITKFSIFFMLCWILFMLNLVSTSLETDDQLRKNHGEYIAKVTDTRVRSDTIQRVGYKTAVTKYELRYEFLLPSNHEKYTYSDGVLGKRDLWVSLPQDKYSDAQESGTISIVYSKDNPWLNRPASMFYDSVEHIFSLMGVLLLLLFFPLIVLLRIFKERRELLIYQVDGRLPLYSLEWHQIKIE